MNRMELLATLLEREEERRDAARRAWRAAQLLDEAARQQAEALKGYRQDYQDRWTAQFRERATMDILRCYHGFVERLDHAITAQALQVQGSEHRLGLATDQLRQRETRVAMVRKLIERRQAAARQVADRREQKQADEAAARMAWSARQALPTF